MLTVSSLSFFLLDFLSRLSFYNIMVNRVEYMIVFNAITEIRRHDSAILLRRSQLNLPLTFTSKISRIVALITPTAICSKIKISNICAIEILVRVYIIALVE